MKNIRVGLVALVVASAALFSFDGPGPNTIKGIVKPADKVVRAWAVSSSDTLNSEVLDGVFEIKGVQPGTYSVIIEAQEPYSHTKLKNVVVGADGEVTDIGEIKLQQN